MTFRAGVTTGEVLCSRFIILKGDLGVSSPFPAPALELLRTSGSFWWRVTFRYQDLGSRGAHCFGVALPLNLLSKQTRKYRFICARVHIMHTCTFMYACAYASISSVYRWMALSKTCVHTAISNCSPNSGVFLPPSFCICSFLLQC